MRRRAGKSAFVVGLMLQLLHSSLLMYLVAVRVVSGLCAGTHGIRLHASGAESDESDVAIGVEIRRVNCVKLHAWPGYFP